MIKKLRSETLSSIKNKRINVFVLFLLFSFIILIFSKLSKEYTDTIGLDIAMINVPQEDVILNDSVQLNVTLKTHGFRWFKYYLKRPKIKIDFEKDVYKKESVFLWNKTKAYLQNTQFDNQVDILNIAPDTLLFRYDVNAVKKVPVKLNHDLAFSPGYDLSNNVTSQPDSITVIGPEILVNEITYLETEKVVLNEVKFNVSEITALKLPKQTGDLKFSENQVALKAEVEKFTEGTLKVPVSVTNVPAGTEIKYFPKEVHVSYYVALSDFNTIKANDFRIVCDYSTITEDQTFLVPRVETFSKDVKNVKINQQRIDFIITK